MAAQKKVYDFAIVGQGLAGTLLAYQLQKVGKSVIVFDNHHQDSASAVAAGIINPITGKHFVLSWRFMDFYQVALDVYSELSQKLGTNVFEHQDIYRTLDTIGEENTWAAKSSDDKLGPFIQFPTDIGTWKPYIRHDLPIAHIVGGGRLNMQLLIKEFRRSLAECGALIEGLFDTSRLLLADDALAYDDSRFKEIIFCQGAQIGKPDPYFGDIGLARTKGQVLIIKCPALNVTAMYKKKIFVVPLGNDEYWVGGGYEWDAVDDLPTDISRAEILTLLSEMAEMPPFEIVEHKAAFRPTVQSRRPVMKTSAVDRRIHLFNGLGTKGASMGPLLSIRFAQYLLSKDVSLLEF